TELEQLILSLRTNRPSWYPVVALAGEFAELRGDRRRAIDAYQSAVELGDNRTQTLERLIATLYADGRYNEANSYLSRLGTERWELAHAETLGIEAAAKKNQLAVALDLATKAVERGSNDPMHYVWLAHLLSIDGQTESAEQAFSKAIKRFPNDPRV